MKFPRDNLIKCRCLALAESCGDAFTHCILTEPDKCSISGKVLMRSVVKTRRRDIGKSTEHVNNDPDMESFTLSLAESQSVNSQNQEQMRHCLLPGTGFPQEEVIKIRTNKQLHKGMQTQKQMIARMKQMSVLIHWRMKHSQRSSTHPMMQSHFKQWWNG